MCIMTDPYDEHNATFPSKIAECCSASTDWRARRLKTPKQCLIKQELQHLSKVAPPLNFLRKIIKFSAIKKKQMLILVFIFIQQIVIYILFELDVKNTDEGKIFFIIWNGGEINRFLQ